ncbi:MAG: hypothetical protein ACUVRL_09270 [Candidatus Saccharicenans sp.]|uniref:hypothetical protein n=1 Tax=Candidatus Saccharicenans sp. TaxID=2819258 RepID=UPI00404AFC1F
MQKNKIWVKGCLVIFWLAWGAFQAGLIAGEPGDQEQEAMENYLKTARVVKIIKGTTGGRTAPWILNLTDGQVQRRAVFKFVNRPRPAMLPDSYRYELAAYRLSRMLDLDFVPPLVERTIDSRPGSLQLMIPETMQENYRSSHGLEPPDRKSFDQALAEILIFENLVYDECLDGTDILIQKSNWKVWRIDFSEAFAPVEELLPDCPIRSCSRNLYDSLKKLDEGAVKSALQSYLDEAELAALLKRKELILNKINELIEEQGEEAIIFIKK